MGYSGHHIVAHHPVSLSELQIFREIIYNTLCYEDDPNHDPDRGSRPGGWHVIEARYGLGDDRDWLGDMVGASRAPVLIVSFSDGVLGTIRGLEPGPRATPWTVGRHSALTGAPAVGALADWSTATDGRPDRVALAALLADEPAGTPEDVVCRLLDALGLSDRVELAPYPHEVTTWDDPVKLEKSLSALQPGRYRALDCGEHGNCYALVRMRSQGDYVLEYREEQPEVLHQTVTPSLDDVITAMKAWARGEVLWRDDFDWTPVSPAPR